MVTLRCFQVALLGCGVAFAAGAADQDKCSDVADVEAPGCRARKGDVYLQARVHELPPSSTSDDADVPATGRPAVVSELAVSEAKRGETHRVHGRKLQGPSCVDGTSEAPIPPELDQNANTFGTDYACRTGVSWEHSDYMLELMAEYGSSPDIYLFKVCWDRRASAEVRKFPWVQSAGADWRYKIAAEGSVVISMLDQVETWANGFQNVIQDALEYFARRGEVNNRKIIPRFMLMGWSKGGTYLWPLCRWRQDLAQASILMHGCDSKYSLWTSDLPKKSEYDGVVPTLFISSALDTYSKCTYADSKKQYKNQKKQSDRQYYAESPCGHHPENCWPVCDYNATYHTPFWNFVDEALSLRQPCLEDKDEQTCLSHLCLWDSEEGFCEETYPSTMSKFCERFCPKAEVATCEGLDESQCTVSYRALSLEEADGNGFLAACEYSGGACVQASSSYQCFFQDQCP